MSETYLRSANARLDMAEKEQLRARIKELEDEIANGWRVSLALAYSGAKLYTDDGELSDSSVHPFIDYRRDSYAEIKAAIEQRGMNWLMAHREEAESIIAKAMEDHRRRLGVRQDEGAEGS